MIDSFHYAVPEKILSSWPDALIKCGIVRLIAYVCRASRRRLGTLEVREFSVGPVSGTYIKSYGASNCTSSRDYLATLPLSGATLEWLRDYAWWISAPGSYLRRTKTTRTRARVTGTGMIISIILMRERKHFMTDDEKHGRRFAGKVAININARNCLW